MPLTLDCKNIKLMILGNYMLDKTTKPIHEPTNIYFKFPTTHSKSNLTAVSQDTYHCAKFTFKLYLDKHVL